MVGRQMRQNAGEHCNGRARKNFEIRCKEEHRKWEGELPSTSLPHRYYFLLINLLYSYHIIKISGASRGGRDLGDNSPPPSTGVGENFVLFRLFVKLSEGGNCKNFRAWRRISKSS